MDATSCLEQRLSPELATWLDHHEDPRSMWETCPRADWLVQLALAVEVDRALIVHAAADVAGAALARGAPSDRSGRRAVAVAIAWIEERASASHAWAIGFAATEAAEQEPESAASTALCAAACVAFACDERADASFYAHRGYAAKAAAEGSVALGPAAAAALVRARIPLSSFLAAFDLASRPPPPLPEPEEAEEPASDSFYT